MKDTKSTQLIGNNYLFILQKTRYATYISYFRETTMHILRTSDCMLGFTTTSTNRYVPYTLTMSPKSKAILADVARLRVVVVTELGIF